MEGGKGSSRVWTRARIAQMAADTTSIAENIARARERIARAAERARRRSEDVTLVAISKTFPAEAIREAYAGGVSHFGENRVREWEGCSKRSQSYDIHFPDFHKFPSRFPQKCFRKEQNSSWRKRTGSLHKKSGPPYTNECDNPAPYYFPPMQRGFPVSFIGTATLSSGIMTGVPANGNGNREDSA